MRPFRFIHDVLRWTEIFTCLIVRISAFAVGFVQGPAAAFSHSCANGNATVGTFAAFDRGNTFTLTGAADRFTLAHVVVQPVGGKLPQVTGPISVFPVSDERDRYGRLPAHLFQEGRWIQGELLRSGEALSNAIGAKPDCRRMMLEAEEQFRKTHPGSWETRGILLSASDINSLSGKTGHFVLVRGRIISVGNRLRRLYLNFGKNWSQDFTVSIDKQGSEKFSGNLHRLATLNGKTVLVRGVIEARQGPLIRVIDEAQIQIID